MLNGGMLYGTFRRFRSDSGLAECHPSLFMVCARVSGATVTFEPGARTAWHTHPLGQTLIVTAGAGQVSDAEYASGFAPQP
ncbi:hypothetical protein ALQ00_05051 [Pseudomonas syringae pv. tomato]|nr:hypothetical protein ALQ00_05051 [Pseudomonas syringae pv. tomato]